MDFQLDAGTIGILITCLGIGIAVIQTIRAEQTTRKLRRLERVQSAQIWHNIALTLNAYETLEDAREYAKDGAQKEALVAKISSARRCIVDQYLDLIRAAALEEKEFTEQTVQRWVEQGRLQNDWRVMQARKFIHD